MEQGQVTLRVNLALFMANNHHRAEADSPPPFARQARLQKSPCPWAQGTRERL